MLKNTQPASYGVIGLGRFGTALAQTLANAGKEVLAIDNVESRVKEIRPFTEHAYVTDDLSRETLEAAGVQNCDVVIVCIGEKLDSSILTTLNVVSLGVPKVVAKAISRDHGKVLEKIGAEVVYPEHDMAMRLAKRLLSNSMLDYISLSNDIDISEILIPERLVGRSVQEADLRKKYGLNIIAIQRGDVALTEVTPEYRFETGDIVVMVGKRENIERFEASL